MFPDHVGLSEEGAVRGAHEISDFGEFHGNVRPFEPATLVFKEADQGDPLNAGQDRTQGIKWMQNGRYYGYWEVGLDVKRLAFRWWWATLMVDSMWAQLIARIFNKLRGYKR